MSQRAVSEADVQDSTCQLIISDCDHQIRPVAIKPPVHSRSHHALQGQSPSGKEIGGRVQPDRPRTAMLSGRQMAPIVRKFPSKPTVIWGMWFNGVASDQRTERPWLRLYVPLVAQGVPQTPTNRGPEGLGFAKDGFQQAVACRGSSPARSADRQPVSGRTRPCIAYGAPGCRGHHCPYSRLLH